MKIGAIQAAGMSSYKNAKIQPAKKDSLPMGADKLEISGSSRLFSDALQVAMELPDERAGKVEAVREQVSKGTYTVNSAVIANRLIRGIARPEV